MNINERTISLIGQENVDNLASKKVIVFGVGGVGGYVVEMLARTNIGHIAIVDFDVVSESNINRQIIATIENVGKLKVDCFKKRILSINPNCDVETFAIQLNENNIKDFKLENYDYIIDCIDMFKSKIALIQYCNQNNLKLISSMGAGNRFQIPEFEICDISKTKNDGLARKLRYELKKIGITHTIVCYTSQDAKKQKVIGSIAYFPAMAGIKIGAFVVNELIKNWAYQNIKSYLKKIYKGNIWKQNNLVNIAMIELRVALPQRRINMEIEHLNDENFSKKTKTDNLVLIDFFATWCGPCQIMGPILENTQPELDGVDVYKVDVDECEQTAKNFGIMSIPTLVLLKNGEEVARHTGLLNHDDLLDFVAKNK